MTLCINNLPHVLFRYKVAYKKETGECRLEISMTFADDAGEYSIFAKNQLGEASASATLMDEGRPTMLSSTQSNNTNVSKYSKINNLSQFFGKGCQQKYLQCEWFQCFVLHRGIWSLHEETRSHLYHSSDHHGAGTQCGWCCSWCYALSEDHHHYLWTGQSFNSTIGQTNWNLS